MMLSYIAMYVCMLTGLFTLDILLDGTVDSVTVRQ